MRVFTVVVSLCALTSSGGKEIVEGVPPAFPAVRSCDEKEQERQSARATDSWDLLAGQRHPVHIPEQGKC